MDKENKSGKAGAEAFLRQVADAEKLTQSVYNGDVQNAIRVAKTHGYEFDMHALWDAITELQKQADRALPTWILERIRVAVHD